MNTTVDDKLNLFTEKIISNIENESRKKIEQAAKEDNDALNSEKQKLSEEVQSIIKGALKKADDESRLIISKANTEKEHALLLKKGELYISMENDIRNMAYDFTNSNEYASFIYNSIDMGISKLDTKEVRIFLKPSDIGKFGNDVLNHIKDVNTGGVTAELAEADEDIIGGCIVENKNRSRRVDCTISAMLGERMEIAGRLLIQSL